MKALINRRIYDTDKSDLLAKATIADDFFGQAPPIEETLYKSPNLGHLFICKVEETSLGYASSIRLVTGDEALDWLLRNDRDTAELFEKIGVEVEEA